MIGDVLLDCELEPGVRRTLAGFENHAGAPSSTPARSLSAASSPDSATTARAVSRAAGSGRAVGTYLHGPLLPRNPWLADWLLTQALAHRLGEAPELTPLADELEDEGSCSLGSPRRVPGRPPLTESRTPALKGWGSDPPPSAASLPPKRVRLVVSPAPKVGQRAHSAPR